MVVNFFKIFLLKVIFGSLKISARPCNCPFNTSWMLQIRPSFILLVLWTLCAFLLLSHIGPQQNYYNKQNSSARLKIAKKTSLLSHKHSLLLCNTLINRIDTQGGRQFCPASLKKKWQMKWSAKRTPVSRGFC